MNTEIIATCVSVPQDDKFFLDFRFYNVKLLPDPDVLGTLPDGEDRQMIWRGLFIAQEIPAKMI